MRKHVLILAVMVALIALPALAHAGWNSAAMSSYPGCKGISHAMNSCRTVVNTSIVAINQQNAMVPVVVPMEMATINGEAMLSTCEVATACEPSEMKLFNTMVPVSIQTMNGCPTMSAPMDMQLANKVVLVPTAYGGEQTMLPVLMKPVGGHRMIFAPLDTKLSSASASASVALMLDGKMVMAPLNWPNCVTTASLCFPASDVIPLMTAQD